MKKEKLIKLVLLIGALCVLFAMVADAVATKVPADLEHFIKGFGYGLMLVMSITLLRIRRKKLAK